MLKSFFSLSVFCCFSLWANSSIPTNSVEVINKIEINSTINPATFEHLKKSIAQTEAIPNSLLLIRLTTPGGLVSTTKEILNLFSESKIPVVVWIAPGGSSATSAGALIASGAHYLFMAEGTNIGAATPITLNGDLEKGKSDMRAKAVNDLVALAQSLCEVHQRNAKLYAEMISAAKSFTAKEAQEQKIIDGIANNDEELYPLINQRLIKIQGVEKKFTIATNVSVNNIEYSFVDKVLNIFSSPELAYILFLLGAALIYFELQAPGGFIAGGIGAVCLVFAGIGFHVLPINFGGVGLIIVAMVCFMLEIYVTSFGLLLVVGLAALTFGSLILFETPDALLDINKTVMYATFLSLILLFGLLSFFLIKTRRQKNTPSFFVPVGHFGVITKKLHQAQGRYWYMAKINGVLWKVTCNQQLALSSSVKVEAQFEGSLALIVTADNS